MNQTLLFQTFHRFKGFMASEPVKKIDFVASVLPKIVAVSAFGYWLYSVPFSPHNLGWREQWEDYGRLKAIETTKERIRMENRTPAEVAADTAAESIRRREWLESLEKTKQRHERRLMERQEKDVPTSESPEP